MVPARCARPQVPDPELRAVAFFCCFFEASLRRIGPGYGGLVKVKGRAARVARLFALSMAKIACGYFGLRVTARRWLHTSLLPQTNTAAKPAKGVAFAGRLLAGAADKNHAFWRR
jgi:hypothetical protein